MINEKAATALATVGTVCWCVQLIPQIYFNFRRKNCEGFPPIFMFLWAACGIPFSIYFISTRANLVVQIQPTLFQFFCCIAWFQSLYYPPVRMNRLKILVIVVVYCIVAVGLELGFSLWLRRLYDHGTKWPTLIFGITASVLLALGLVPPYFELAKRKGRVYGINFLFIFIDMCGAFFSMMSVVVGNMDVMGIILYCVCVTMELGIFTSHFVWWLRFKAFNPDFIDEEEIKLKEKEELDHDEKNGDIEKLGNADNIGQERVNNETNSLNTRGSRTASELGTGIENIEVVIEDLGSVSKTQ
ncbi:hypothetical protein WICPIJ_006008 [Wickerhamomyces pijperi]|uniref:Uncharacterized protein n=1 Tax=Wickerhamomyces pijperi TaxID=599730 RepID=A0A9P8Q593_WICPI|nr:hypothetical protein WICPIJ_006008 [Wickerhamomyces pijperi]